jgi:hypothetical protein
MANNIKPGAVIFTGNHKRLAKFYEAMTGLALRFTDDNIRNANQMSDMLQLVVNMGNSQCVTLRVISLLECCQSRRQAEACRTFGSRVFKLA